MSTLVLRDIVNNISFNNLPNIWQDFDLKSFSKEKTLYDFQQDALKNALKCLWLYYGDKYDYQPSEDLDINLKRKEYFLKLYRESYGDSLKRADYKLSPKTKGLLEEYYQVEKNKVNFKYFINRMSFWMATGSGKTLVIIKLIEILKELIENRKIPEKDILFLSHRDDLLKQFRNFVKEFNEFQRDIFINLKSLKEYEEVKRETQSLFRDKEITVFYYRSDNLSDKEGEKVLDFKDYENDGGWYILLDEAHKGDKEDSKRQVIYSILSRNGFLFNFSATFVDPRDFVTTVFNFNLKEYIEKGFGKHIYLVEEEVEGFKKKDDFSKAKKQEIVLKSFIVLTYIRKHLERIRKIGKNLYHKPLLLTLVNSVNTEDADLELFFREIERIGKGEISQEIFKVAKRKIWEEFQKEPEFKFGEGTFKGEKELLEKINYQDILRFVYNSKNPGTIEVLKIPNNKKELVFKLKKADKPFALIKIGDVSNWLKEKLESYEINESFDNEGVFEKLNRDDSDINILMGSRGFYEGWDSNRPNFILFINIGVGSEAKKFVLQSVGRGVRIEPIRNKRKRLSCLYREIKENLYEKIKKYVLPLETLFIFGTNKRALEEVIKTLEAEKGEGRVISEIKINKLAEEHPLLIPTYTSTDYIFAEKKNPAKFKIHRKDLEIVNEYFRYLNDLRVILVKYESELKNEEVNTVKVLKKVKESLEKRDERSEYYRFSSEDEFPLLRPDVILRQIIHHFSLKSKEFKEFKELEEEIVHFKRIRYTKEEKLEEFLEEIKKVKELAKKEKEIKQLGLDLKPEASFDGIKIKYVPHHYYIPLILSEVEKIKYLQHIIKIPSEVKFIKDLESYLIAPDNLFSRFDWWLFSKIDESTDEVYLPYYNFSMHEISKFKPDFIFWLKKGKDYFIIFIDPKSTKYTDYQYKVDGYKEIFEDNKGKLRKFVWQSLDVKVGLFLRSQESPSERYRKYWFDDIEKVLKVILS